MIKRLLFVLGCSLLAVSQINNPPKVLNLRQLNGSVYVSQFSSLQAAINNFASGNGSVIVDADITLSADTIATSSQPGIDIQCINDANITYTTSGRIRMQGVGDSINNCTLTGPGVGTTHVQAVTMENDQQGFRNNIVTNFGSSTGSGILEPFAGNKGDISNNWFFNNADNGGDIFINNTTTATVMDGWRVIDNLAGSIIAHTTTGTANITNLTISNNTVRPGENSRTAYGIEVGAFGGATPFGIVLVGNNVTLQANGTQGGISLSTINPPCSESGDTFNNAGFTFTISSFEHVLLSNCAIANLSANEGTGGNGLTCDRCNHTSFSNIAINGFTTAGGGYGFHTLVSSTVGPSASDNVFSNITVTAPATFTGNAFWEQCNATGATCNNNSYTNLHVVGTSGTTGNGFTLENDVGTMTNTTINNSQFENLSVGINQIGTRSNVKLIESQFASTTTLYGGTLTGSFIVDPGGAFSNQFSIWQGNWASQSLALLTGNRSFPWPDYSPVNVAGVVAKGTTTLTSATVTTATCQTAVSTAATGTLTTDTIEWAYATAPTGTTDARMTIAPYVTSGNVNFSRCNPTASSIVATAIVVNWKVIR